MGQRGAAAIEHFGPADAMKTGALSSLGTALPDK